MSDVGWRIDLKETGSPGRGLVATALNDPLNEVLKKNLSYSVEFGAKTGFLKKKKDDSMYNPVRKARISTIQ